MKKTFLTIGLAGLLSFSFSSVRAEDISYGQVVLRGLDKITGRLSTMTVNVGEKTTFGALDIYARVCYAHPPEETPENAAFLDIVEKKEEGQLKLFSGWMFSSSPALSAMDHAVYDVWVIKCQGDQVPPPAPEPLVLENPIEVKPVQPKLKIIWDEEKQAVENVPSAEQEKPVDPENTDSEMTPVSAQDVQETESIVIHVEQPQQEQNRPTVIFGQEGKDVDPNAGQNQEFRLIPIEETPSEEEILPENANEEGVVFEDNFEEMTQDSNSDMISHPNPNVQTMSEPNTQISSEIEIVPTQQDFIGPEKITEEEQQEEKTLFSEESETMEKAIFSTDEDFEE